MEATVRARLIGQLMHANEFAIRIVNSRLNNYFYFDFVDRRHSYPSQYVLKFVPTVSLGSFTPQPAVEKCKNYVLLTSPFKYSQYRVHSQKR